MLNSSKYFRKHAQIRDSFVVKFSSHRLKILVEFKRAHYAGISKFHLGFQINFSKNNFCVYYFVPQCSFITVVQRTVEKQQLQRRLCVGEFQLTFIAGFPQTDFDTKLVNFFLKLVLPVILKELLSNFLISTLRLFQKLSHK